MLGWNSSPIASSSPGCWRTHRSRRYARIRKYFFVHTFRLINTHMLLLYACLQLLNFGLIDWLCLEGLAHVRAAADWSLQVPGPVPEECRAQQTYANSLQGMLSFFLNKTSETHVSVTFVWLNTLKLGLTTLSWNVVFSLVVIVLATSISTLWCCLYSYGIYLFCLHNEFHHSQSVFLVKCWITQPSTNC